MARCMIGFALLIRIHLTNSNCFVNHRTIILYKMCKALATQCFIDYVLGGAKNIHNCGLRRKYHQSIFADEVEAPSR